MLLTCYCILDNAVNPQITVDIEGQQNVINITNRLGWLDTKGPWLSQAVLCIDHLGETILITYVEAEK